MTGGYSAMDLRNLLTGHGLLVLRYVTAPADR
jgi:hypothetical protein